MAFPLNSAHLISHLRSSYLVLFENDTDIRTMLGPNSDDPDGEIYQEIFNKISILSSPPIEFISSDDKFNDKENSIYKSKNSTKKRRSRIRKRRSRVSKQPSIVEENSENEQDQITDDEANILHHDSDNTSHGDINSYHHFNNSTPQNNNDHILTNDITDDDNDITDDRITDDELTTSDKKEEKPKNGLKYSQTINPKRVKNNLIRFFHKDNDGIESDGSTGSVKTTKLPPPSLSNEPSGQITDDDEFDSDSTQKISTKEETLTSDSATHEPNENSEVITLGSNTETSLSDKSNYNHNITLDSKDSLDDLTDEDDDDYDFDEEEDEDEEEDDNSSTDSAFTDIETDSMMDSSILLDDSFDTADYSYGQRPDKFRKKKSRLNSFGLNSAKDSSSTFQNTVPSKDKLQLSSSSTTLASNSRNYFKKPIINFEKINPIFNESSSKTSNLSSLLQLRNKSVNINPLFFYSFVESGDSNSFNVNIFVPPKTSPTLTDLQINTSTSISDCIGYILLELSKLEEFQNIEDFEFLDPNYWRLELVDEDGENYGSFGILDRTRLFSSYNNPKELAICKVEDVREYKKNQSQSPLALEFKQNLIDFRRRQLYSNEFGDNNSKEDEIMIKDNEVNNGPPQEFIQLFITAPNGRKVGIDFDSNFTVKEVLYDFCSTNNLNPANYKLRLVMPEIKHHLSDDQDDILTLKENSDLINDSRSNKRNLNNNESIKNIESSFLELVPTKGSVVQSLLTGSSGSNRLSPEIDNTISPVNVDLITPPRNNLELDNIDTRISYEKTKTGIVGHNKVDVTSNTNKISPSATSKSKIQSLAKSATNNTINSVVKRQTKKSTDSTKYFDDLLLSNGTLFGNNARYFTWKVWRKKTTILNKIEKSLIIDGDYIRLQPPEDKAYLKNPDDNPFLQNQSNSHHHRHLHHYNYSNYYNGSMMKTSSFHVTQIVKLKQYKNTKNPNHFKIVIDKPSKDSANVKKKYDLEAVDETECEEIIEKIKWVLKIYNSEMSHINRWH